MGGDEDGVSEEGDCGANEKDTGNEDSEQGDHDCGANEKNNGNVNKVIMTVVPIKKMM